jgi:hypothetical protein
MEHPLRLNGAPAPAPQFAAAVVVQTKNIANAKDAVRQTTLKKRMHSSQVVDVM